MFSVSTVDRMYTSLTLTSVHFHCSLLFFLLQLAHSLTSVHAHVDRTSLEPLRFEWNKCSHIVILSSYMVAELVR